MRKLSLFSFFASLFLGLSLFFAQSAQAATCTIDPYLKDGGSYSTYCSVSCGSNTYTGDTGDFTGCGAQYCCANRPNNAGLSVCGDTKVTSGGKSYDTYCSLSCGSNPGTTGFTGCGAGQSCCQRTASSCEGGCKYGRRTYCAVGGGGNAEAPGMSCDTAGTTCYLGSFDAACPNEKPPAGSVCGLNDLSGKQTYCSVSCGSNTSAPNGWGGCGVGSTCCVSSTAAGTAEEAAKGQDATAFEYCKQAPAGAQRSACEACVTQTDDGGQTKVYTAFGCMSTSGSGLTQDLVTLLLGIVGGIALLSILAGAFLVGISRGDVNNVKQGKELITASVSGILFIIFSVMILDFIGVRVLRIPGLL